MTSKRLTSSYDKRMDDINLPEYSLSYLINADSSGLTQDDIDTIDAWLLSLSDDSKYQLIDIDTSEPFFTWHPAFGLACTCVDATIIFR